MTIISTDKPARAGLRREIKLLVVDDHLDHFAQIQEFTEMYHPEFKVECKLATSPCQALELSASWEPSVVLLDLHMVSSALELLRQLSNTGATVVATSNVRLPELSRTAEEYGAVGYYSKGHNLDGIEALVNFASSLATTTYPTH